MKRRARRGRPRAQAMPLEKDTLRRTATAATKLAARLARLTGSVRFASRRDVRRSANLAGKTARYLARALEANYSTYARRTATAVVEPAATSENADAAA
jgi:hypothetical protein